MPFVPPPGNSGQMNNAGQSSYEQILKSSTLIGGSSAIALVIGMVRIKAMALLLAPAGYGLFALYWNISELARIIAGMGINGSAVRQIAEAAGTGDDRRIARTVMILRRLSWILGILGALLLLALREPISRLSFGDESHAGAIALLSLAVFLGAVSNGRMALLQGMRRIADLALAGIWGALLGALLSIAIIYLYRDQGIVPALVGSALVGSLISWRLSRRIELQPVEMTTAEAAREGLGMLKPGFVFMTSALLTTGVAYGVQLIVLYEVGNASGIETGKAAVGCYQAAWFVGGYFASFILQAMGTDFYPRLSSVAQDNAQCNRLVNEQAEVGLLLAGPGLLATLTFAPLVILLQYSAEFRPAADVLRWICLGMMLRVIAWPVAFVIIAKNEQRLFFWTEVAGSALQIGLVWLGVRHFGLIGTGVGFAGMYAVYLIGIRFIARSLSGFRWTAENVRIGTIYGTVVAALFVSPYFLPQTFVVIAGSAATLAMGIYSLKKLCRMLPLESFPRPIRRLLGRLRLLPASNANL